MPKWLAGALAALGVVATVAVILVRVQRETAEVRAHRALAAALDGWGEREDLRPAPLSVTSTGAAAPLVVRRCFWISPRRNLQRLGESASRLAAPLGLRAATGAGGAVRLLDQAGTVRAEITFRRGALFALVLDDFGFGLGPARAFAALPCPVTIAVIPLTPFATETARLVRAAHQTLFIHMPMAPFYKLPAVPEYSITIIPGQDAAEVNRRMAAAFASVPGAVGLNNHEGTSATADPALMADVMATLVSRRLAFLDSVTTEKTVAWKAARDAGLRWAINNDYLDAEHSVAAVDRAFASLLATARRKGSAIGIGHYWSKATLQVLQQRIPEAERDGITFVSVMDLMHAPAAASR